LNVRLLRLEARPLRQFLATFEELVASSFLRLVYVHQKGHTTYTTITTGRATYTATTSTTHDRTHDLCEGRRISQKLAGRKGRMLLGRQWD
jgi:hypothetical protein